MDNPQIKPKNKLPTSFAKRYFFRVSSEFISPLPFDECVSRLAHIRLVGRSYSSRLRVEYTLHEDEADYQLCEFHVNRGPIGAEVIGRLVAYPGSVSTHVECEAGIGFVNQIISVMFWVAALIVLPTWCYQLLLAADHRSAGYVASLGFLVFAFTWSISQFGQKRLLRTIRETLKGR